MERVDVRDGSDAAGGAEALVMQFLARVGEGDADAIAALFAENIDWHVGGDPEIAWSGARSQRSEVADYFKVMWSHFDLSQSATALDSILVSGNEAVVFARFANTAATTGRQFETPVAMRIRVENGEIVTMHLHEDTWAVSKAFAD